MVPHTLAAFDEPEIADDAVSPAAHAGELHTLEMIAHARIHACSMHCAAIPSNLDERRIECGSTGAAANAIEAAA